MIEFVPFRKVPRLNREIIITEKIDGTNAQVHIRPYDSEGDEFDMVGNSDTGSYFIRAGSRSRWLKPTKSSDNFGFAGWVYENASELVKLGPGAHYGEWWGSGIQRGYDQKEKHFSLFDVHRWRNPADAENAGLYGFADAPACCRVVPVLYRGPMQQISIEQMMLLLEAGGSEAAPGYMNPEGIMIYHTAARQLFKKTFKGDEEGKERAAA